MHQKQIAISFLRLSLGIIFLWFGLLKIFDVSPVMNIIILALPPILGQSPIFLLLLALVEIVIGALFLINRFIKITAIVTAVHLTIASIAVLITQGFDPYFPLLTLEGEFVAKNLILIAAAMFLVVEKSD